jgi:hypothetical protein
MNLGTIIFDENIATAKTGYDAIPAGIYTAIIEEAKLGIGYFEEQKPEDQRDYDIRVLRVVWKIIDSEFANRKIFQNLKINKGKSSDELDIKSQAIGQMYLHKIMGAAKLTEINSEKELVNIKLKVTIKIKKKKDGSDENIISDFASADPDLSFMAQSVEQQSGSGSIWA